MTNLITIDITSDTICPWCFIGKRRLESALKDVENVEFKIKWHPFYLDPMAETQNKMERYRNKFGEGRAEQMMEMMKKTARAVGINMEYGGNVGNTRNSHRLIALADEDAQLQDRVVNALFHAYFEVNEDISDVDVLSRIGVETGIFKSEQEGKDFFASETGADQVDKSVNLAYRRDISGVPFFVYNNRYSVEGAQDANVHKNIINKILRESAINVKVDKSQMC